MDECKGIGMEHLAIGSVVGLRSESCILFAAVDAISNKGIAKVLKVNANLMGATGVEDYLYERGAIKPLQDAVACVRGAAFAAFDCGHGAAMARMSRDRNLNFTRDAWQFAAENRVIDFLDGAVSELIGE